MKKRGGIVMNRLKDKVAVVTGSTSGIGLGIARAYAAEGAKVAVCGYHVKKRWRDIVINEIRKEGGDVFYHDMDLDDPASIESLVADTVERYGTIDILVNNAANVTLADGRVDELTIEMWDAVFKSDLRGTFYMIKCTLPHMLKNEKGGSIINIGSMATCGGDLSSTAYSCAKAGVNMLTQSVALQYGKDNIRCNCVRPGLIISRQNEKYIPQAKKDIFLDNIMVNRHGRPEDIAHACVYLGSEESAYVTGQIITVDGGLNAHVPTVAQFRSAESRTW